MSEIHYHKATFLLTAVQFNQLPPDEGAEIAFVGRSNAGKSSALNAITGIKGLARTSKTPGRTQAMNVFLLDDEQHRFVDLPGYGYAKVPLSMRREWDKMMFGYLSQRQSLRGLVLIMDARHPLKEKDWEFLNLSIEIQLPIHILLTKADKLKFQQARDTLKNVRETLSVFKGISVQLFSSTHRSGLEEAKACLTDWFLSH